MKNIMKVFVLGLILSVFSQGLVYASDLNGIGVESNIEVIIDETQVENETGQVEETKSTGNTIPSFEGISEGNKEEMEDTAKAVGDMFGNAGIDEESIKQANAFIRPFASILNKLMAGILGLTSILMMFVTVLDLAYIALPFTRDMLDGGMQGQNQMQQGGRDSMGGGYGGMSRGNRGMGGAGGYGGGMSGAMGSNQQHQQLGGGLSAIGRWVSDEAVASVADAKGGPMGASTADGTVKTIIFSYMKKRAFFLIMFGVCVILFTSTIFTDLGVKLGTWLLRLMMGIGG